MITKIKGTYDLLPEDTRAWQRLESIINQVSKLYNYEEIRTPIFEASELFHRGVGDSTDIVKKETYDFLDRGERSVTLRPEGTAGVVRSIIENKLYANPNLPLKYYYVGPMFRYERPQKGRQRQFHQFGAEAMGSFDPKLDAEVIGYAVTLLKALRLENVKVKINSLGDKESKLSYRQTLLTYLSTQIEGLCPDCQHRYLENPLRVLDCKVDHDNPILQNAPKPLSSLNSVDQTHFNQVLAYLDSIGVDYVVDESLVRGLDYYTHTVFELEADLPTLGAQATLGGGGRYNDLVENLDGPQFPAVGFALGMERLLLAMESLEQKAQKPYTHVFMITLGEKAKVASMNLLTKLRHGGLICDTDFFDRPLKGQFKQAERVNPKFILILGDDELDKQVINVKNTKTNTQETVALENLYQYLVSEIQNEAHQCSGHCSECEDDCE